MDQDEQRDYAEEAYNRELMNNPEGGGQTTVLPDLLTEDEADQLVDGFQSGSLDALDLMGMMRDPAAWLAESESYPALRLRGRRAGMLEPHACDRCYAVYDEAGGDGYCGLCPTCADDTEPS